MATRIDLTQPKYLIEMDFDISADEVFEARLTIQDLIDLSTGEQPANDAEAMLRIREFLKAPEHISDDLLIRMMEYINKEIEEIDFTNPSTFRV